MVSYGLAYGMEAYGLGQRLSIATEEAAGILDAYFVAFPSVQAYMDATVAEARDKGYTETLFGRRRQIPELSSSQLPDPPGRRAPGHERRHPGPGRRHLQGRAGPARRARSSERAVASRLDPAGARRGDPRGRPGRAATRSPRSRSTRCRVRSTCASRSRSTSPSGRAGPPPRAEPLRPGDDPPFVGPVAIPSGRQAEHRRPREPSVPRVDQRNTFWMVRLRGRSWSSPALRHRLLADLRHQVRWLRRRQDLGLDRVPAEVQVLRVLIDGSGSPRQRRRDRGRRRGADRIAATTGSRTSPTTSARPTCATRSPRAPRRGRRSSSTRSAWSRETGCSTSAAVPGRHAHALGRRGIEVLGVDISAAVRRPRRAGPSRPG